MKPWEAITGAQCILVTDLRPDFASRIEVAARKLRSFLAP
jgi:hypothetical protein